MGIEFTESGVNVAPVPLQAFRFESPLVGIIKTANGYEGWYNPGSRGMYTIRLHIPLEDANRFSGVKVNGKKSASRFVTGAIEMRGEGGGGSALRWSVSRVGSDS